MYASVALNDALSFWARLVLLLTGLIVLGLAHDEPSDERAGEFFGALADDQRGRHARRRRQRRGVPVRRAGAGEHPHLPAPLPVAAHARRPRKRRPSTSTSASSPRGCCSTAWRSSTEGRASATSRRRRTWAPGDDRDVPNVQLGLIAIVFVMAGLCFRVAAVPLHFYAPDVYQGSPTVIAALLSWVPKAVGFLAILRALAFMYSRLRRAGAEGNHALLGHRGGDHDRWATSSRCCRRTSSGCWRIPRSLTRAT